MGYSDSLIFFFVIVKLSQLTFLGMNFDLDKSTGCIDYINNHINYVTVHENSKPSKTE